VLGKAYSIALTTDGCTLPTGDAYIAVTSHWLDPKWRLQNAVLGVSANNGMHTGTACAVV
jgi:hypothetical protein